MTTEVVLERLPGEKYRVTGSGRFAVSAEGDLRDEAIANFQQVAAQVEVLTVEISPYRNGVHPPSSDGNHAKLLATVGRGAKFPPEFRAEVAAIIERNRQEENERMFFFVR